MTNPNRPSLPQILARIPAAIIIGLVRLYQVSLGLFIGGRCRFHPSCSFYMIGAVKKYGAIRGTAKGIARILRCHPFHPGGYDPP
ncbi:membrane protein insertion efficiency factor YidD [Calycomorphotria hydatis]|nr:membrane protein insertion efficiency factor YidD [Calycomorphotria hydatis]